MEKAKPSGRGGGGQKTIKNASTQVVYQRKKEDNKKVQKKQKQSTSIKTHHGQIIGKDPNDDRWQCNICSFKNSNEIDICATCDSKKGEQKPHH